MPSQPLLRAFEQLMQAAPSPLFRRARSLYLNKYPLDGRDCQGSLRLFVLDEDVEERIEPETGEGRKVILTIKATQLALVHWQAATAAAPKEAERYFQDRWGQELPRLSPREEPWFRNGGHQSWLTAPEELQLIRSSSLAASAKPSGGS